MTAFWRKVVVRVGYVAASLLILAALLVSATRLLTPLLNDHRAYFEKFAARLLNRPVEIGEIVIVWSGYEPELTFHHVIVRDPETHQPNIQIPFIKLDVAIIDSLFTRTVVLNRLSIIGVHLTLHEKIPGEVSVEGFNQFFVIDNLTGGSLSPNILLTWIISQPQLVLKDCEIRYISDDNDEKSVTLKRLALHNTSQNHQLTGQAILNSRAIPTQADIHFNWKGSVTDLPHVSADLSLDLHNLSFSDWFARKTWHAIHLAEGIGNATVLAHWRNHTWQNIQANFTCYHSIILFDRVFDHSLVFDQLTGSLRGQQNSNGTWIVSLKSIQAINPDLDAKADMSITFPLNDSPSVDLLGHFALWNVKNVSQYLPLKIYAPALKTWLRNAFLGGEVLTGNAILQGKLDDFPFDNGLGKFQIDGILKGVEFNYAPSWPIMHHVNGKIIFSNRSMAVDVSSANILTIPLQAVHGDIPNLGKNATLTAKTIVQGELAQGLEFIQKSPLQKKIGKSLSALKGQGPMQLSLTLTIPLSHPNDINVRGDTAIVNAKLSVPDWNITLDRLNGTFQFTENSITASRMKGQFLERPVTLDLATEHVAGQTGNVTANLQGVLNTTILKSWLNLPIDELLRGETHYTAKLILPPEKSSAEATRVNIYSDLSGVAVNLPDRFGKKARDTSDFQLSFLIRENQPIKANILYNKLFSVDLLLQRVKQKWDLLNAELHYNDKKWGQIVLNAVPTSNGLAIKRFNVDSSSYQLRATGLWANTKSQLQGKITATKVNDFLNATGFSSNNFIGSTGNVDFDLNWPAGLSNLSLQKTSGTIGIQLGEGHIIHIGNTSDAKMGLGRLLNIFSLQSLPRRLSLNFSDLFEQGYGFDSMKGNFTLQNGNAMTQHTRFIGAVASIDISGRIGFVKKDLDILLSVTPHVTSSLPVVAAIATANPIAGVATWMVDKMMVGPAMSQLTNYTYAITGSWDKPAWNQVGARR